MRFRKSSVKIRGIRPLLFHAFTLDVLSLERKEKSGVAGNDPAEWRRSMLITEDLPTVYSGELHIWLSSTMEVATQRMERQASCQRLLQPFRL